MDVAQLGIQVTSTGVPEAAKGLDNLSGAAARAEQSTVGLSKATGGATGTTSAAARAYANQGAAAASTSRQIDLMTRSANQNNSAVGAGTSQLRLMSMQLSQVGQQTQVTGNFLQALAIQLPDLALGFGPFGIAVGIAAGAALTFFSSWLSKSEETSLSIKQQQELIRGLAEAWGTGIPAIDAYIAKIDEAKTRTDALAAAKIINEDVINPTIAAVENLNIEFVDFLSKLQQAGTEEDTIKNLNNAFQTLREKVAEGKSTQEDFNAVLLAAQTAGATGVSGLDTFTSGLSSLMAIALAATGQVNALNNAMNAASNKALNDPATWRGAGLGPSNIQETRGDGFQTLPWDGPTPGSRPLVELEGLPGTRRGGGAKASTVKSDTYKSSIQSMEERTRAMQAETAAQASLNPLVNDYGYSLAKAKASADLLAAAERAKKEMTPELNAQIERTAAALAEATEQQNRQAEAIQKAKEQMEFVKSTAAGFINDLRDGLKNGEGFWKSFGNAAMGVLDRITDKLLNDVLDAVFKVSSAGSGSGGGGIFGFLGSLFTGGGSASGASTPSWLNSGFDTGISKYANGTMSARSGVALVGEKGPELVRFRGGEQVVPSHQTMSAANQNAGGATASQAPSASDIRVTGDFRTYVDENGNWQAKVENISASVSKSTVNQYDKDKATLYQNGQAA